ncbi:MAG: tetratricopeptide repeat protein [Candidatus Omnitrophota bacterium]|nr:tetratricopeptide repeat protein [Candidatus Omnitrophota bacterium]
MEELPSFHNDDAERYFQEAYEKQMAGEIENAISLYLKSLELCPTAEAHTFLGWAYSYQGRYDEAINECRHAIDLDPEFGNPYNDIGAYLIEKDRLDEAIEWLEKATVAKRYESYCYPYYNLGRIWERKGDWMKALNSYESSLKSNPNYTLARKASTRLQAMFN